MHSIKFLIQVHCFNKYPTLSIHSASGFSLLFCTVVLVHTHLAQIWSGTDTEPPTLYCIEKQLGKGCTYLLHGMRGMFVQCIESFRQISREDPSVAQRSGQGSIELGRLPHTCGTGAGRWPTW